MNAPTFFHALTNDTPEESPEVEVVIEVPPWVVRVSGVWPMLPAWQATRLP